MFDRMIMLGDLWDMPSLSSYDTSARKAYERRSYLADKQAGDEWLKLFHGELDENGVDLSETDLHFCTGNHEKRADIACEKDPSLIEHICTNDVTAYANLLGWRVHPFLKPVKLDGIMYSHYFPLNARGGVTKSRDGCPDARAQATRARCSTTAGHRQGFDYACMEGPTVSHGVIAGSFYLHDEAYLTAQGNHYWRGVVVKNDVHRGDYDLCKVSVDYLYRRYSNPL